MTARSGIDFRPFPVNSDESRRDVSHDSLSRSAFHSQPTISAQGTDRPCGIMTFRNNATNPMLMMLYMKNVSSFEFKFIMFQY